jgi:hypothetical protein
MARLEEQGVGERRDPFDRPGGEEDGRGIVRWASPQWVRLEAAAVRAEGGVPGEEVGTQAGVACPGQGSMAARPLSMRKDRGGPVCGTPPGGLIVGVTVGGTEVGLAWLLPHSVGECVTVEVDVGQGAGGWGPAGQRWTSQGGDTELRGG